MKKIIIILILIFINQLSFAVFCPQKMKVISVKTKTQITTITVDNNGWLYIIEFQKGIKPLIKKKDIIIGNVDGRQIKIVQINRIRTIYQGYIVKILQRTDQTGKE